MSKMADSIISQLGSPKRRRLLRGLVVAMSVGAVVCAAFCLNLFSGVQLQSTDFFFKAANLQQSGEMDEKIMVIGVDDKSLDQLGRFSTWTRSYYAELIDILAEAEARVVVFDILFSEPAQGDEQLAASIRDAGNVILPVVETSTLSNSTVIDEAGQTGSFRRPLAVFEDNALALGHANISPDVDGVARRVPLAITSVEGYEPALSLAAVAKYLRRPDVLESGVGDNELAFAGRSIPVGNNNEMLINYAGKSEDVTAVTFQIVSFADVLGGQISDESFTDKLVIVGATAIGFGDIFWTPMGQQMNGVEVHANAMHTILTDNFLRPAPSNLTIALILVLAFLCGLVALRLRVLWATLAAMSLCAVYFITAFTLFDNGLMLNMVYPPLTIVGTFVAVNLHNVAAERSQRKEINRTFGRYVSPSVVDKIVTALEEGELKLGGGAQEATVAFADVRGFTSLSERMMTEELVGVLNVHLSTVIKAVLKYDGMINKFGGDSVMAIWNAPTPCERHALLAVRAAMEVQKAVQELGAREKNMPEMKFGIGINTGKVVAGNMGSEARMEYSVIGDAVNTTARITGVTPGGRVWIGASTYELVKNDVIAKPLEPLVVKGKREPVIAYEVIDVCSEPLERYDGDMKQLGDSWVQEKY